MARPKKLYSTDEKIVLKQQEVEELKCKLQQVNDELKELKTQKKIEEQNSLIFLIEQNGFEIKDIMSMVEEKIQK